MSTVKPPAVLPKPKNFNVHGLIPTQSSEMLNVGFDAPPVDVLPSPTRINQFTHPTTIVSNRRSSGTFDGPEEVDFGEDNEQEIEAETARCLELNRMSHIVTFEQATVDDYHDLDVLLEDLDNVFRESRVDTFSKVDDISGLDFEKRSVTATATSNNRQLEEQPTPAATDDMDRKMKIAMDKLSLANIRKITSRIYIEHAKMFKTLLITSLMNASQVTANVKRKAMLDDSDEWTLFELVNDLGIERPLRDFEIVTDVLMSWEIKTVNALLVKKYGYRDSLKSNVSDAYPRMCGWLYLEVKRGKWQRRFFELKASGIYHSKDAKGTQESQLCSLSTFDVYTLMRSRQKAPTKFCFALKSQQSIKVFEDSNDYVSFVCVDNLDKMKDWVLSIRNARSQRILAEHAKVANSSSEALVDFTQPLGTKSALGILERQRKQVDTGTVIESRRLERMKSVKSTGMKKAQSLNELAIAPEISIAKPSQRSNLVRSSSRKTRERETALEAANKIQAKSRSKDIEPLINVIEKQQGDYTVHSTQHVNKTQFGDQSGKPLVPFTARELQKVPGVDISKYAPKQRDKEKEKYKTCGTCECADFARNPFKEISCANCFHIH